MVKITYGQTIAFIALFAGGVIFLLSIYLQYDTSHALTLSAVSSFLMYIFYLLFTQRYLSKRIRGIYKIIQKNQGTPVQNRIADEINSKAALTTLEKDVEEWVSEQEAHMRRINTNSEFRREFLGNVSHELKTPLFNMQGYIHTLLDGAMDDPRVRKDFLQKAAKNIDRLCSLVDDLDIISQLETSSEKLVFVDFDAKAMTLDILESLELKARQQNITLQIDKETQYACRVHADRDRMRQVLTNLVDNAIKYGSNGGSVIISYHDVGDDYLIEVADDGIGIPEDAIPRLFERFYRVDKSRSREVGGSGLGLSIVKHIIEAHGKTISVRSGVGVGTVFSFTLQKAKGGV